MDKSRNLWYYRPMFQLIIGIVLLSIGTALWEEGVKDDIKRELKDEQY